MSPACALALAGRKSGSGVYGKFLAVWLTRSATEGATSQQEKTHGKMYGKILLLKHKAKTQIPYRHGMENAKQHKKSRGTGPEKLKK